jgi:broad specificity phosphatase PhoE
MTTITLVRHGETTWHGENRYAGSTDVALTPKGLQQAEQLARWAHGAELTQIWCSNLSRAQITAAACTQTTGLAPQVDPRLREVDFGAGEGLTSAEMEAAFPEARRAFTANPATHPLPGGEDPATAVERFTEALLDIANQEPEGRVLVVAHTTAIRLTLCSLLGIPLDEYRRKLPSLRNCALTTLRIRNGDISLLEYNVPVDN